MYSTIIAIMLTLPQRDAVVILDESKASKIVVSEWNCKKWDLIALREECDAAFNIKFINRIDSKWTSATYPCVSIDREPPTPLGEFGYSGEAITRLHETLMDGYEDYAKLASHNGDPDWQPEGAKTRWTRYMDWPSLLPADVDEDEDE